MKPNIKTNFNNMLMFCTYTERLANKIKLVCSKINFSYQDIKWVIFDPKEKKYNYIQNMLVGCRGVDYGFCYPAKKEIWISTLAISKDYTHRRLYDASNIIKKNNRDFLADVIMDEIAHISTGCNHGNDIYDTELKNFRHRYYHGIFSHNI